MIGASVLFAVYGLGLGAMLKNQAVALVVGLAVTFVVEPIIVGVWPSIGRWMPNQAAHSLESLRASAGHGVFSISGSTYLLPWWQGALILLAYGVALAAVGSVTTMQTDIS